MQPVAKRSAALAMTLLRSRIEDIGKVTPGSSTNSCPGRWGPSGQRRLEHLSCFLRVSFEIVEFYPGSINVHPTKRIIRTGHRERRRDWNRIAECVSRYVVVLPRIIHDAVQDFPKEYLSSVVSSVGRCRPCCWIDERTGQPLARTCKDVCVNTLLLIEIVETVRENQLRVDEHESVVKSTSPEPASYHSIARVVTRLFRDDVFRAHEPLPQGFNSLQIALNEESVITRRVVCRCRELLACRCRELLACRCRELLACRCREL